MLHNLLPDLLVLDMRMIYYLNYYKKVRNGVKEEKVRGIPLSSKCLICK